jgi:small redox-active disulfide protein 2
MIRVGEDQVGIRGLKKALRQIAETHSGKTDHEIEQALVEMLGETNYMAECAIDEYGRAFLREFRKFLGQSKDDPNGESQGIVVLGPGCAQCNRLDELVKQVLMELKIGVSVEHVTDLKEIAKFGIIGTPALVINGKIMSKGTVPPIRKIREWIRAARF